MQGRGIEAVYRRPRTSAPARDHKIFPYLLRGMTIDRANQVWASDITYVRMARGFIYLTAVMDWFTRRVLAWRLSITLGVEFCIDGLEEALHLYGRPEIFNSDQRSHEDHHERWLAVNLPRQRAGERSAARGGNGKRCFQAKKLGSICASTSLLQR
jgi:transposase InsO family protein